MVAAGSQTQLFEPDINAADVLLGRYPNNITVLWHYSIILPHLPVVVVTPIPSPINRIRFLATFVFGFSNLFRESCISFSFSFCQWF